MENQLEAGPDEWAKRPRKTLYSGTMQIRGLGVFGKDAVSVDESLVVQSNKKN